MPAFRELLSRLRRPTGAIIPVIRLTGTIGGTRGALTIAAVERALARAFAVRTAPAVAIVVNSPGGAAVQSHLIFKRIRALADERGKRVLVAVEDVAASGGYMIAAAGDEIVVDASSIVGSIGVISAGFGFPRLLERIGVERRVHTAGQSKAMLDPFQPERDSDVARLAALQADVHASFIDLVKRRRPKLAADPDLFTGAFWSGAKAVELGLADSISDLRSLLRARFGEDVRVLPVATDRSMWRRRLGLSGPAEPLSSALAGSLVDRAVAVIEERMLWSRFGL